MKRAWTALPILLIVAAGCASARTSIFDADSARVWPQEPDRPRVRFLGQLQSADQVKKTGGVLAAMRRVMYGPEEPVRLKTPYAVAVHANGDKIAVADTSIAGALVFDLARQDMKAVYFDVRDDESPGPIGVVWAGDTLFIADAKLHCVGAVYPDGHSIRFGADKLQRPAGIAYHPGKHEIYIVDAGAHAVLAFDLEGRFNFQFGQRGAAPGQLNYPSQIGCAPNGELVVADSLNFRIQRFTADGKFLGLFGDKGDAAGDFALPKGVAVDSSGNIWVADAQFENVQAFSSDGHLLMAFGGQGHDPGKFWLPSGLAIDSDSRLWVADTYNRRIQVFELLQ